MKNYRIIFNNDGGTLFQPFFPLTNLQFNVNNFINSTINYLVNTHVDVLSWTLGTDIWPLPDIQGPGRASNFYCHKTNVGERFYELKPPFQSRSWYLMAKRVKEMILDGNDPPIVLSNACKKENLDFFLALRMNDSHDGRIVEGINKYLFGTKIPLNNPVIKDGKFIKNNIRGYICKMKLENPNLLIGEHETLTRMNEIAFDYANKAVRDFRFELIKETINQYDIDGIELDFLRNPIYFKPGQERKNSIYLTEFIEKVHNEIKNVERKKSKKIKLAIRTLVPLSESYKIGLDVKTWLEEGYIDILIGGMVGRINLPMKDVVKMANKNNCPVYGSIKTDELIERNRYSSSVFRGISSNLYNDGVQGIYLFNMTAFKYKWIYKQVPPDGLGINYDYSPLSEIGSWSDFKFKEKLYIFDNKNSGLLTDSNLYDRWANNIQERLYKSEGGTTKNKPLLPKNLSGGEKIKIPLRISDNLIEAKKNNYNTIFDLSINISDLSGGLHLLTIKLNDILIKKGKLNNFTKIPSNSNLFKKTGDQSIAESYNLNIKIKQSILKIGNNTLLIHLIQGDKNIISDISVDNVEITVKYEYCG